MTCSKKKYAVDPATGKVIPVSGGNADIGNFAEIQRQILCSVMIQKDFTNNPDFPCVTTMMDECGLLFEEVEGNENEDII